MQKLLLLLALASCGPVTFPGAPVPGADCPKNARYTLRGECISSAEIAYCENGKWVSYACPGDCRNAQAIRCDWSLAEIGTPCSMVETGRYCVAGSDKKYKQCVDGRIGPGECGMGVCNNYGTCD